MATKKQLPPFKANEEKRDEVRLLSAGLTLREAEIIAKARGFTIRVVDDIGKGSTREYDPNRLNLELIERRVVASRFG